MCFSGNTQTLKAKSMARQTKGNPCTPKSLMTSQPIWRILTCVLTSEVKQQQPVNKRDGEFEAKCCFEQQIDPGAQPSLRMNYYGHILWCGFLWIRKSTHSRVKYIHVVLKPSSVKNYNIAKAEAYLSIAHLQVRMTNAIALNANSHLWSK